MNTDNAVKGHTWFPINMKHALEKIQLNLRKTNIVLEVLDARIPVSSRNSDLEKIIRNKQRIVILNKSDLASDDGNQKWIAYFERSGTPAVSLIANKRFSSKRLISSINKQNSKIKSINAMIVGIPNVGKSTIINLLSKKKKARIENRPGITRGEQLIRVNEKLYLIDTPGVLYPNLNSEDIINNLSIIGSLPDASIVMENTCVDLISRIDPSNIIGKYDIVVDDLSPMGIMDAVASKHGCILSKSRIDYNRVSRLILNDFRAGKFGKITLEYPDQ